MARSGCPGAQAFSCHKVTSRKFLSARAREGRKKQGQAQERTDSQSETLLAGHASASVAAAPAKHVCPSILCQHLPCPSHLPFWQKRPERGAFCAQGGERC